MPETAPKPFISTDLGEFRNIYRRADGTERHGCTWRDRATAEAMREVLPGETFVELRDMRFASDLSPTGTAPAGRLER
ncbi:hypothetical protein [Methylobacterium nonmethylotrophicum]|uniref:Uncharacterized protein n=1 Tax=Methylobacterium nonmethylotrophicum TaxID=1141884 RepID=A0A4Z0NQL3_9HYPH|nr:hypothetical protein [Methylobacterium nonmethylotrophicum]TGD98070.1 hypothetical protein EU555_18155 [Methylobacterium nonmethylotrophicum]